MSYEKGVVAFFDGTKSDYKKALKPDGDIAGYKVASITLRSVKLTLSTNAFELPVGMRMSREVGSDWQMTMAPTESNSGNLNQKTISRTTFDKNPVSAAEIKKTIQSVATEEDSEAETIIEDEPQEIPSSSENDDAIKKMMERWKQWKHESNR